MNELESHFRSNTKRLIHKWNHYFEIYDRYFRTYRGQPVTILEIGISQGGSLQMWKEYFGAQAQIIGMDIDPRCKQFEEDRIQVHIGSQSDRNFLRELKNKIPKIDILIDDGGHTMEQQIITFEELFDHIKEDGVYVCEDLHTSYWFEYGGGHKRKGTFIEYSKNFIDYLNAFHSKQNSLKVNSFTKSVHSIHYYDSMLIVEKRNMTPPYDEQRGEATFLPEPIPISFFVKSRYKMASLNIRFHTLLNKIIGVIKTKRNNK